MQQPAQGDSGGDPSGFVAPMPMGMMGGPAGTAGPGVTPGGGSPAPQSGAGATRPATQSGGETRPSNGTDSGSRPKPNADDSGTVRNEQTPRPDEAAQSDPSRQSDASQQGDPSQQDGDSRQDQDASHKKEADGGTPGDSSTGDPDRAQQLADAEQQARDILDDQFGSDAPTVDFTSTPLDPAAVREINNAIRQLAADYPETMRGLSHIGSEDFGRSLGPGNEDVLAYATPGAADPRISINSDAFSDNARRALDGADEEQTGFTVPGGGSTEGVFTHEFGHHLGEQLLNDPRMLADLNQAVSNALGVPYDATQPHDPATQQRVADGLSEYGSSDPHEMLAEAFTEYRLAAEPRDLARAVGEVMDRHLGAQNPGGGSQGGSRAAVYPTPGPVRAPRRARPPTAGRRPATPRHRPARTARRRAPTPPSPATAPRRPTAPRPPTAPCPAARTGRATGRRGTTTRPGPQTRRSPPATPQRTDGSQRTDQPSRTDDTRPRDGNHCDTDGQRDTETPASPSPSGTARTGRTGTPRATTRPRATTGPLTASGLLGPTAPGPRTERRATARTGPTPGTVTTPRTGRPTGRGGTTGPAQ